MNSVFEQVSQETDIQDERVEIAIVVTPEVQRIIRSTGALAVAQAYDVDCAAVAQALADERRGWASAIDKLDAVEKDLMEPVKVALTNMKGKLSKWFGPRRQDLTLARALAGQKLLAWENAEKERVARENAAREAEARRIRQEAERRAAEERAKAEEAARIEREKAAAAEEARRKAQEDAERARREGDAKAAAEADRRAKAAAAESAKAQEKEQAALENGAAKAQEAQMQAAAVVSAAPVATVAKIAGSSLKDNWLAELKSGTSIDQAKVLIVEANHAGRHELLGMIEIDTAPRGALNKLAAALKSAFNVPGFVSVNRQTIAGSRK